MDRNTETRQYGFPYSCYPLDMKTTIDIPEALYKRAKIRAVEQRTTLRDVVLGALERDIAAIRPASLGGESQAPDGSRRQAAS